MANDLTRITIVGYGNVAKGVHRAIGKNPDTELSGILTRDVNRTKNQLVDKVDSVFSADSVHLIEALAERTDIAILCGGSKSDLPKHGPIYAVYFNTVDSFDTHDDIPAYFRMVNGVSEFHKHTSIISGGWDPGIYSDNGVLANAFLPESKVYRFYGLTEKGGVSQGHSDAIRQVEGVADARQYTHAKHETIERVRSGENPELKPGDLHWRECFVVEKSGADKAKIEDKIVNMESYYKPYHTTVEFISQQEMDKNHSNMPHDGVVIAASETGDGNRAVIEYSNKWESNPEATGNILVTCARACHRINKEGKELITKLENAGLTDKKLLREIGGKYFGAKTMTQITSNQISPHSNDYILEKFM